MTSFQEPLLKADGGSEILVVKQANEPLSHAILRGVSDFKDIRIEQLDTLYYSIDVNSTKSLLNHAERHDCNVDIEFIYEGCEITIENKEVIKISTK